MAWGMAVGAACTGSRRVVTNVVVKFANDWSMNLASMIAYTLITAIFPILLAVLLPLSLGAASLVTAGSDWFDRLLPEGVGAVLSTSGC